MYFSSGTSTPCSTRTLICGVPGRPLRVNTWITPFAASEPYSVLAAPPRITSTRSISDVSSSASADDCSPPVPIAVAMSLSTRTPST